MGQGTMNHENGNTNMVTGISNVFGKDNISKLIAGAAVGLALTLGVAMPGAASVDSPLVSISSSSVEIGLHVQRSLPGQTGAQKPCD